MMSSSPTSNNLIPGDPNAGIGGMEVDQDVAGWVDSLLPNQSPQGAQNQNNGAHDSGIGEMNGNNDTLMCSASAQHPGGLSFNPVGNVANNNLQPGDSATNTMFGMIETQQTDSFLDDSDMIMSTLQSPVSVHQHY